MSRYRKIEVRTWADERFRRLSPILPSGQGLWFFLLTGPHTGPIPGLFRAGRAAMAEELDWDIEAFDKAFQEVFENGMAKADFKARLVWLPNALKHNKPESPNVVRSWRVELDLLPECDLKNEAIAHIREALEFIGPSYVQAFDEILCEDRLKPSGKPSVKTLPNQEQKQEQKQEQEKDKIVDPPPASPPPCPHQAIISLFHEVLPGLPQVVKWTDTRQEHLRKCWRDETRQSLEWWKEYFVRVRGTPFLLGENDRNWQADLEWLTIESNLLKVLEGKYSGIGSRSGPTRQSTNPALANAGRAQSDGAPWPEFTSYGPD